jgi:hypothetical protein
MFSGGPPKILACALACGLLAGLSACGSSSGRAPQNVTATERSTETTATATTPAQVGGGDKRAKTLGCLHGKGIDAVPTGAKSIEINGKAGPRIDFFQSSLEAEGNQFEGNGEGAEQIGAALLFVKGADDKLLNDLELCLNDQSG